MQSRSTDARHHQGIPKEPIMIRRCLSFAACAVAPFAPPAVTAQAQAQVTLNVPVNLTQLSPDITKIRVGCSIRSEAITVAGSTVAVTQETAITGGQFVATVPILFNLTGLDSPTGKIAYVSCFVDGWNAVEQGWGYFMKDQASQAFRTNVTLYDYSSTFRW
jgi:hypothetical protein